ncbi:MAG: hypothetical protein IT200_00865 [Thermoleophilia bacterium]|nr:hypothetical protein [Thermoleophilia bacterium]
MVTAPRATAREAALGMDVTHHGEEAYVSGEGASLIVRPPEDAPVRAPARS